MLCLGRRTGERVMINGGEIVITVLKHGPEGVRLGIEAPPGVVVDREEVHRRRAAGVPAPQKREEAACRS